MANSDFKFDLEFDLSKYDYKPSGDSSFSIDDILDETVGASASSKSTDLDRVAEQPEVIIEDVQTSISSQISEEKLPVDNAVIQDDFYLVMENSEESGIVEEQIPDLLIAVDGDSEEGSFSLGNEDEPILFAKGPIVSEESTFTSVGIEETLIASVLNDEENDASSIALQEELKKEPIIETFLSDLETEEKTRDVEPSTVDSQGTVVVEESSLPEAEPVSAEPQEKITEQETVVDGTEGIALETDIIQQNKKIGKKAQVIDEYSAIDEREDILFDLSQLIKKITTKCVLMFLLLLMGVYLSVAQIGGIDFLIPNVVAPDTNPSFYMGICLFLSAVCFLINIVPLFDGLKRAFKLRISADGFACFFGLICILYDVYFVLNPEDLLTVYLNFDVLFILMLLMNLMGKRTLVKHIYRNFAIISGDELKSVLCQPSSSAVDNDIMIETGSGGEILYARKTRSVSEYMKKAFSEQNADKKTENFYFVLVLGLIATVCILCLTDRISRSYAVICLAAGISVCAPLFATWAYTSIVSKLGVSLSKYRTVITDRDGAKGLIDSRVLVVRDSELISDSDISLHGMRIRDDLSVDHILCCLSALFTKVGGPLNGFFNKIIDESNKGPLPNVSDILYHDQLGYTCVIGDEHMAVGNDDFMKELDIDMPTGEQNDDERLVYIAIGGRVAGVFTLSYSISTKTKNALKFFEASGTSVAIITSDFNLREEDFSSLVTDGDMITMLSSETCASCGDLCGERDLLSGEVITEDGLRGLAAGLIGCGKLLLHYMSHTTFKIAASAFGFILCVYMCATNATFDAFLPIQILIFQLIWNIPNLFSGNKINL